MLNIVSILKNLFKRKSDEPKIVKLEVYDPEAYTTKIKTKNQAQQDKKNFASVLRTVLEYNLQRDVTEDYKIEFQPTELIPEDEKDQKIAMDDKSKIKEKIAMDAATAQTVPTAFTSNNFVGTGVLGFFGAQGFAGWQINAILAQHWLIKNACSIPGKDAVRNGYDITINNGEKLEENSLDGDLLEEDENNEKKDLTVKILDDLRQLDIDFNLVNSLAEMSYKGKIFGIRIVYPKVVYSSPRALELPFNIDNVKPGSYKGLVQLDPYWTAPVLDDKASGDMLDLNFYEPTWWVIRGTKIHRTHLIIYRTEEVADILKPTYYYGGIPLPQQIMEAAYSAERTSNEAPRLAMSKRTKVLQTNMKAALTDQETFDKGQQLSAQYENNFSMRIIDKAENMQQFDTSLADLDAVIMTQQQRVAAVAKIPVIKLFQLEPKGFNQTGSYSQTSYNETLEDIQTHDYTPVVQRHHELLVRSVIVPTYNIKPFKTMVNWKSLSQMTAKDQADVNKAKNEGDATLINAGVLDAQEVRRRLISDPDSGHSGIEEINEDLEADIDSENNLEGELFAPATKETR